MTHGDLMGKIRSQLWVPDGKPLEPGGDKRDGSILKRWIRKRGAEEVNTAIDGFVSLRDSGQLMPWIPPKTKCSLRALAVRSNGGIVFYQRCVAEGFRMQSKPAAKKQAADSLAEIFRRAREGVGH